MWWSLLALDLVLLLIVQSLLATALLPRRGQIGWTFLLLVVASLIWLVPQAIGVFGLKTYCLLTVVGSVNWIVTACGLLVFSETVKNAPLEAAAIDGCGFFGIYRHIGLPLAKRKLLPLGFLAVVLVAFAATTPVKFDPALAKNFELLAAASLLSAIPLIILFFLRRQHR